MKDLKVLSRQVGDVTIGHVVSDDRVTDTLLKYGCPEDELWLITDSTISNAENWWGDIIWDLTDGKDYKRCIYYQESGSICAFAAYNNVKEFEAGCKHIADYLK